MGLYIDGNEYEKSFHEAVSLHATPGILRYMMVKLYQQGSDPRKMYEEHEAYLMSDIPLGSTILKKAELMTRLIQISDRHGGRLMRDNRLFQLFSMFHVVQNYSKLIKRLS